jgi:hypothetical protein
MKVFIIIISLLCSTVSYSQKLDINISSNRFGVDENLSLIVARIQNINAYQNIGDHSDVVITLGPKPYSFISTPDSLAYTKSYSIKDISSTKEYTLYFTELPIGIIETENTIVDEPKVSANFTYSDNEQTVSSNIGIELRGGNSLFFPKKTYDIEFWKDESGEENRDMQFGELRKDDDWILDALYNEPLRIRSYIANKLWKQIHAPYYLDEEPNAKAGADVMFIEIFVNGNYNGIYNLSEQVDRKQLKIKKFDGIIDGELYQGADRGATTFKSLVPYNNEQREWGGYEFEYPDEDEVTDWNNLFQFTDFVINSSTTDFANRIWSKFSEENFIDYFLFLNLIRATDNLGKNIFLGKYKANEPYFYIPWDLDGCFGNFWDGTKDSYAEGILTNGFMNRVINENPNNTFVNIASKWFEYRKNVFSLHALSSSIADQYNFLDDNKMYERESLVYPNYSFDEQSLEYTLNWLEQRLEYLDTCFQHVLEFNSNTTSQMFNIFPNPARHKINIDSTIKIFNIKKYAIYSSFGRKVSSGLIRNQEINIQNLEKGMYFLKIDDTIIKFIKI